MRLTVIGSFFMTDILLPDANGTVTVQGAQPLVIIGPNGVGKTQLGVALTRTNSAQRVAALRNVEITDIPMQTFQQASQEVKNALNDLLNSHWRQSYELQNLLAEILAEDREQAVAYRAADLSEPNKPKDINLSNTRLIRIVKIWNRHFPGRKISMDYAPKVVRTMPDGREVEYSIAQMSEGERTALYLSARVVSCKDKIMVVDEPETFFHPVLAKNLWDDLEREAPDVRFIYITHDIPFALSRYGARFAIARPENRADLLPETSAIPSEVISEVLGAASFSIGASRLIFCEGEAGSLDLPILRAWHNCTKTAVVPAGSCNSVRECVAVFRAGQITGGLTAFGYIDRDAWPDTYLASDPNVHSHPFNEIEGIFCCEPVFLALAKRNGLADPQAAFQAFMKDAHERFVGPTFHKEILQRAKLRVEIEQRSLLNPIKPNPDLSLIRTNFISIAPSGGWPAYLQSVFDEEATRLNASYNGSADHFLRDFPSKSYYKLAAQHLGYLPEKMLDTLIDALELTDAQAIQELSLHELRDAVVAYLEPRMFPRSVK
jgi:ABC-type cobalamin/Fe3+-siderophores transport system ATPase subunit